MQLLILVALVLHVLSDLAFISVLAHGARKISVGPKLPSPQLLLHLWALLEYRSCRNALDHRHDLCHAIRWHRLHQEMHVILVCTNLQKLYLVPQLNSNTRLLEHHLNLLVYHYPAVLCREHQVIQQYRDIVIHVNVFAHPTTIPPQGAANSARVIKKNLF